MKKFFSLLIVIFISVCSVACVIETPGKHYASTPDGEPTGTYAFISVTCAVILENLDKLDARLREFVPDDGVLMAERKTEIRYNDNALKFTTDALTAESILFESSGGYLRSVNSLGEKACGAESGWLILINGKFASVGAGAYKVKENDRIEWRYTVKLGDLGVDLT